MKNEERIKNLEKAVRLLQTHNLEIVKGQIKEKRQDFRFYELIDGNVEAIGVIMTQVMKLQNESEEVQRSNRDSKK